MLLSPKTGQFNPQIPQPGQGQRVAGRPDFDLTHPDKWPQWLKNAHTENASVEVLPPTKECPEGWVMWWGGAFHDGIWMAGDFCYGVWRDGIWLAGDFRGATWRTGEFMGGNFQSGIWYDGVFRAGTFRGLWLSGIWRPYKDGAATFNGFRERTTVPPNTVTTMYESEVAHYNKTEEIKG
jgi:hypothetical protein